MLGAVLDSQAEDGRPAPSERDAEPPADPGGPPASQDEPATGQGGTPAEASAVAADSFPLLRAATGALSSPGDRFEYGLAVLIEGLRARHPG